MIKLNDIITTTAGNKFKIVFMIGKGTEGSVARAINLDTGRMAAIKIFHKDRCTSDTLARIRFLCAQELHKESTSLVTPREIIHFNGMMGYVMEYVEGIPLQVFLENTPLTFMQRVICLLRIVLPLIRLHARGISHGDIRQANVLILLERGTPVVHIIDFDNFSAKGVPGPACLGDEMYLPPEQYKSMKAGNPIPPNMGSDKYALRIMAEEILTLRHPSSGYHQPDSRFEYAMYECWVHDPALPPVPGVGGLPAVVLNSRVANLFRRGMHAEAAKRPDLVEWANELVEATHEIHVCTGCHLPCLVDTSRLACPHCGKRYPDPNLVLSDGGRIPIIQGFMQVGRAELRAGNMVSAVHAVLRRIGPLVTLESFGMNGTYHLSGGSWIRLEDRKPVFLSQGDELKFANVKARVE